ncbi:MAG TPA: antifreeze protein, partial [Bacteroidales bacterium]|nr:antifreeze protein [Bacteroidales bacterium]
MSLFNRAKQNKFKEFINIIEWTNDTADTIIWRFPHHQTKIKSGAQLIVRENQVAVLVNEGQFADVYQPGCYELTANNMPIFSTQKGWKNSFNSPFKVDVCFVSTKEFLNKRWGTVNPIMMCDPEFGLIRFRVFGSFCFRVGPDPIKFISKMVGADGNFTIDSVSEQLHNFVITKFTNYLAESKIAVLDLAANLNEFSSELTIALKDVFSECGIGLFRFLIENISLPEAVEEALHKLTTMTVIGKLTTNIQPIKPKNGQVHNAIGINSLKDVPPPVPAQEMYHVAFGGVQQGPFPMAQLQQMVQQGQLCPGTLVWTAGMTGWVAA